MTQAERFVRNLCEDTKRRITAQIDDEVSAVEREVALSDVPRSVRSALLRLKRLKPQVKAAEKVVDAAGFDVPGDWCSCDEPRKPLMKVARDYRWQEQRKSTIRERHHARTAKVQSLQNAANIAVLGKTGAEAKDILTKLQRELATV